MEQGCGAPNAIRGPRSSPLATWALSRTRTRPRRRHSPELRVIRARPRTGSVEVITSGHTNRSLTWESGRRTRGQWGENMRCGLRFGLLGAPVLYDGDAPNALAGDGIQPIGSIKVRTLLAALLLEPGRVVPVETLKDALWGGAPPASAQASLHNHVARLRRLLDDPGRLRAIPPGYLLRVGPGELDVHVFQAHVERARAAHANQDWQRVLGECASALALWRGAPLTGLPPETVGYAFTQRLAEARLLLLEWRYDAELYLGGPGLPSLIPELTALTAEHPLRESFHRQLMLTLHRTGRRAESLAVHRDLRNRLLDELGVEPGASIRAAHVEVLRLPAGPTNSTDLTASAGRGGSVGPGGRGGPVDPEAPEVREAPEAPEVREAPEAPEAREVPEVPEVPEVREIRDVCRTLGTRLSGLIRATRATTRGDWQVWGPRRVQQAQKGGEVQRGWDTPGAWRARGLRVIRMFRATSRCPPTLRRPPGWLFPTCPHNRRRARPRDRLPPPLHEPRRHHRDPLPHSGPSRRRDLGRPRRGPSPHPGLGGLRRDPSRHRDSSRRPGRPRHHHAPPRRRRNPSQLRDLGRIRRGPSRYCGPTRYGDLGRLRSGPSRYCDSSRRPGRPRHHHAPPRHRRNPSQLRDLGRIRRGPRLYCGPTRHGDPGRLRSGPSLPRDPSPHRGPGRPRHTPSRQRTPRRHRTPCRPPAPRGHPPRPAPPAPPNSPHPQPTSPAAPPSPTTCAGRWPRSRVLGPRSRLPHPSA